MADTKDFYCIKELCEALISEKGTFGFPPSMNLFALLVKGQQTKLKCYRTKLRFVLVVT